MGVNSAIYNVFSVKPPFFLMADGRPSFLAKCHLTQLPLEYCSQRSLIPCIYQGLRVSKTPYLLSLLCSC